MRAKATTVLQIELNVESVTVGNGFIVTKDEADEADEHPAAFFTITEYEPPAVIVMLCVVCPPGLHK